MGCLHVIFPVWQPRVVIHFTLKLRAAEAINPIDHGRNYKDSCDVANLTLSSSPSSFISIP